jgi:hypothetical protein
MNDTLVFFNTTANSGKGETAYVTVTRPRTDGRGWEIVGAKLYDGLTVVATFDGAHWTLATGEHDGKLFHGFRPAATA